MEAFLAPGKYVDSDHPEVVAYAMQYADAAASKKEIALSLYFAVRDGFRYNPYRVDLREESLKASNLLKRDNAHCVEKACVLAAACRVHGIPARLGYANVRNHIGTSKLEEFLGSNVLVFHGYTQLYLEGQWVIATPAFNKALCIHLGVAPLDFNGHDDSMFQEYDTGKGRFMEYLHDYGLFADVPRELFITSLKEHYGHLFDSEKGKKFGLEVIL